MARSRFRAVLAMAAVTVLALAASAGAGPITIPNAGFEERATMDEDSGTPGIQPMPDGYDRYNQWAIETWRHFECDNNGGPLRIWNPGVPGTHEMTQGAMDVGFGGNAPGGDYVVVVRTRYNDDEFHDPPQVRDFEAAVQLLPDTFDPAMTYTLTAKVGRLPSGPGEGGSVNYTPSWYGYGLQLAVGGTNVGGARYQGRVEGGTILAQDNNSLTVPVNGFVTSTVTYTPTPADSIYAGLPIQIRLAALEDPADHSLTQWAAFDDVTLDASPGGGGAVTTITGTAAGPGGSRDTWNNDANWDNGVPSGTIDAVVGAGVTAQVNNAATPTYDGTLTLLDNSTLQLGWTSGNNPGDANPLISASEVTMNAGSQILMRNPFTVDLPAITLAGDASIHLSPSTSAHGRTRNFDNAITGTGDFTIIGNNRNTANLNVANTFSGNFIANADDRWHLRARVAGSLGPGDVTINRRSDGRSASLYIDAADVIADTAALRLNGLGYSGNGSDRLIMNADDTINELWIDGARAFAGTYTSADPFISSGAGTLTVLSGPPDLPPTLSGTDIVDDVFGGPIWEDFPEVNYTVTFSDDMDAATVTAADFGNAGTASFSIGAVTKTLTPQIPTLPSVFAVQVLPSSAGSLQLQVNAGAVLTDVGGNALDTTWAILDDTTITIIPGSIPPTTITGTANGPNGAHDTWNEPANWDNGIPFGSQAALVAAGVTAQCWNNDTPAYTGSLTLLENSTLQIGWTTSYPPSNNALGQDGITMMDGSTIILRQNAASGPVTFREIDVQGDAVIKVGISTARHHQSTDFDGEISGPGQLTIDGVNNSTVNLNVANTVGSLVAMSTQNQGWRLEANVPGALGAGDVTIENRTTLIIDALDAIADIGVLTLNGSKDNRRSHKLFLNYAGTDTIAGFWLDGVQMAPGTYDSTSGLFDIDGLDLITGSGALLVRAPGGIVVIGTAGDWDLLRADNPQPALLEVDKRANSLDPFDMEITVTGALDVIQVLEAAVNNAGIDWVDYHIQLGFGLGPDFVPSQAGDALGFADALSQAFPGLLLSEDELSFAGGIVPVGGTADFALTINLPGDDPFTFTLRQWPTPIPEPATLSLLGLGALLALRRRRRSR